MHVIDACTVQLDEISTLHFSNTTVLTLQNFENDIFPLTSKSKVMLSKDCQKNLANCLNLNYL